MSGLEAGGEAASGALMQLLYYLVGFILVMAAPILAAIIYGSASLQLMTFSFIIYAILAGIVEGMVNSPVVAASIDIALILTMISNYASIYSTRIEGFMKASVSIWPLIVVESYNGHTVFAPDFTQLSLLTLLYIHRRGLVRIMRSAYGKLRSSGPRVEAEQEE